MSWFISYIVSPAVVLVLIGAGVYLLVKGFYREPPPMSVRPPKPTARPNVPPPLLPRRYLYARGYEWKGNGNRGAGRR